MNQRLVQGMLQGGATLAVVADAAGVSTATIWRFAIANDLDLSYRSTHTDRFTRFEIRELHRVGFSLREIAHRLGVSLTTVHRWANKKVQTKRCGGCGHHHVGDRCETCRANRLKASNRAMQAC